MNCELSPFSPACRAGQKNQQNLEYRHVALPSGIAAHQDLIRLLVYDQNHVHLTRTNFTFVALRNRTTPGTNVVQRLNWNGANSDIYNSVRKNGGNLLNGIGSDNRGDDFEQESLLDDPDLPFSIRTENGNGVVYTLRALDVKRSYQMRVEGASYDRREGTVEYHTTFVIFISVSSYPY